MNMIKTAATGRIGTFARLALAFGFAATLLAGQAVVFDSPASAAPCDSPECVIFDMEKWKF